MAVRCLLVDDNHDFLRGARTLLEREGITVVGAVSTGTQAYYACRKLKPDVALVDIGLGEETGFDVARQLTGLTGPDAPRVILISASAADDLEDMIADSTAISFLPKASLSGTAVRVILSRAGGLAPQDPQHESR